MVTINISVCWSCQRMGIGMLRPRQVALWNKYFHYSLDIQLRKQSHRQKLQKTTANKSSKRSSWIIFGTKGLGSFERNPGSLDVSVDFTDFILAIDFMVPGQHTLLWNIWAHLTLKSLFLQYFVCMKARVFTYSTVKIIKWNSLRKPYNVEVRLGAIAVLVSYYFIMPWYFTAINIWTLIRIFLISY